MARIKRSEAHDRDTALAIDRPNGLTTWGMVFVVMLNDIAAFASEVCLIATSPWHGWHCSEDFNGCLHSLSMLDMQLLAL
jgi:hypothetical protein